MLNFQSHQREVWATFYEMKTTTIKQMIETDPQQFGQIVLELGNNWESTFNSMPNAAIMHTIEV